MSLDQVMGHWPLWQQAQHGQFTGVDGIDIRFAILRHPEPKGAIVVSNGRIETFLKYWPLAEQLHQQGFSVYLWDHRGQGLSGRMLANPHVGHVNRFDDYLEDMAQFYQEYVAPDGHRLHYLLGHSMGGAIATLYLSLYPDHFDRAAVTAPMYGIRLPAPAPLLQPVIRTLARLLPSRYVPGGHDYDPVPFERNELTGDLEQYQAFRQIYQQVPQVQLGDPSNHWLSQALAATEVLSQLEVSTPLLVLQAGQDSIVCNQAQTRFCQRQSRHQLEHLAEAKHEILIERDSLRKQAVSSILSWYEAGSAPWSATGKESHPAAAAR
ncbi:alpha/beta fold hydrolase [Ferrimonas marina]|uniref:Lysophospholipase n=1 Tax=Ferrimonas marina TaxID=299255 RepID=A0A1M5XR28_9GAMM|nr:alpha/beta fold hydrolase [Ferrimonas marina]SHI01713.1 lysophospholipase [Ferrimonas marina]